MKNQTVVPTTFKKDVFGTWVNLNSLTEIRVQNREEKFELIGVKDRIFWIFEESDDEELLKMNLNDFFTE